MNLARPFFRSRFLSSIREAHFLSGVSLKKRGFDGDVPVSSFDGKLLVLYFSAGWCGSCKILTTKLKKFYDGLGEENKNLEIVWISRDREADHQLEYYEKAMPPCTYIPFGDPNIQKLLEKYQVKTIPVLKLVGSDGQVIGDQIRADVEAGFKENQIEYLNNWKKL